jgi:hypothetical protein
LETMQAIAGARHDTSSRTSTPNWRRIRIAYTRLTPQGLPICGLDCEGHIQKWFKLPLSSPGAIWRWRRCVLIVRLMRLDPLSLKVASTRNRGVLHGL